MLPIHQGDIYGFFLDVGTSASIMPDLPSFFLGVDIFLWSVSHHPVTDRETTWPEASRELHCDHPMVPLFLVRDGAAQPTAYGRATGM